MPVHDWRRQREKQHLYEAREGGCMEWRSARASLSLSLHSHCLHRHHHHHRRLLLSGLRVNGRHSEQVCIRHLLASSVKWNDCHREGQVSKVRGWCIPVYSRCVMSVVCYSVWLLLVCLVFCFIFLFYTASVLTAEPALGFEPKHRARLKLHSNGLDICLANTMLAAFNYVCLSFPSSVMPEAPAVWISFHLWYDAESRRGNHLSCTAAAAATAVLLPPVPLTA